MASDVSINEGSARVEGVGFKCVRGSMMLGPTVSEFHWVKWVAPPVVGPGSCTSFTMANMFKLSACAYGKCPTECSSDVATVVGTEETHAACGHSVEEPDTSSKCHL